MKCALFLVGIALLQITNIKCDNAEKISQCSADLLIPEEKIKELRKKIMTGYCRQGKAYKKNNAIDDNYKVNEENLKKFLEKRYSDKEKLEEQVKLRMECASQIKDPKNNCEFVGAWNICTRKATMKNKKEEGDGNE